MREGESAQREPRGLSWKIVRGDCVKVMSRLPDNSVDSISTDPPYGLGFMGAKWDKFGKGGMKPATIARQKKQEKRNEPFGRSGKAAAPSRGEKQAFKAFMRNVADQAIRVLKPGAYALAFGGTRTYHWLVDAWEDSGFEIRDCLMWVYGQGFPKSVNLSKAMDKSAGVEPIARKKATLGMANNPHWNELKNQLVMPPPQTEEAKQWYGWGSGLKPCYEPIVLMRKPPEGALYRNVLNHGVGGLNIHDCSVGKPPKWNYPKGKGGSACHEGGFKDIPCEAPSDRGRWPGNLILDPTAGAMLDQQSGITKDGVAVKRHGKGGNFFGQDKKKFKGAQEDQGYGGEGGASRYFKSIEFTDEDRFFYCAKPSRKEKDAGLGGEKNPHSTVKPIALLRYLARLITPPGGLVLDPFAGSGSQGCACRQEGFRYIGIEKESKYVDPAIKRVTYWDPMDIELAESPPEKGKFVLYRERAYQRFFWTKDGTWAPSEKQAKVFRRRSLARKTIKVAAHRTSVRPRQIYVGEL